jgi:UDP-glucose 6-dehydrogenase
MHRHHAGTTDAVGVEIVVTAFDTLEAVIYAKDHFRSGIISFGEQIGNVVVPAGGQVKCVVAHEVLDLRSGLKFQNDFF